MLAPWPIVFENERSSFWLLYKILQFIILSYKNRNKCISYSDIAMFQYHPIVERLKNPIDKFLKPFFISSIIICKSKTSSAFWQTSWLLIFGILLSLVPIRKFIKQRIQCHYYLQCLKRYLLWFKTDIISWWPSLTVNEFYIYIVTKVFHFDYLLLKLFSYSDCCF